MTQFTPAEADVEALCREIASAMEGDDSKWQSCRTWALAHLRLLHSRGWRPPAEARDERGDRIDLATAIKNYSPHFAPWWHQHNGVIQRAHTVDIIVRKDGVERRIEGDFLKLVARMLAEMHPAAPEPAP